MFKLDFVQHIYNAALNSELVSQTTQYSQILSGFFVMYALIYKYFASKNSTDEANKFTPQNIYYSIFILAMVFTYPKLLDSLDWFTIKIEELFIEWSPDNAGYTTTSEHFSKIVGQQTESLEDLNVFQSIVYYLSRIYNYFTHPGIWVMDNFRNLFMAVDTMIFGIALISRAIKMFMLRIVGSLAIVASLFDSYSKYYTNWIRLYILNYMYVGFLFVINYFSEFVYYTVREAKLQGVEDEFGYISTLAYITMLFVKVGLYRKSYTFLREVFSNS